MSIRKGRIQTVLVVDNDRDITKMFLEEGFRVFDKMKPHPIPDLVCFSGGTDIGTHLYGERPLETTEKPDTWRDTREVQLFKQYKDIPKVGICRGGQLLNVLSGGSLWQHVTKHEHGNHVCDDLLFKSKVPLNSFHHQMMIAGDDGDVLAITHEADAFYGDNHLYQPDYDTEVVYYPDTRSLCYQPHPEWSYVGTPNRNYFIRLIDYLL